MPVCTGVGQNNVDIENLESPIKPPNVCYLYVF